MEEYRTVAEKEVIHEYDSRALKYGNLDAVLDAGAGARVNSYYNYISKRWVKKYVHLNKQDIILDFGCGSGRLTQMLAPHIAYIKGIDASGEMIKQAQATGLPNALFEQITNDLPDMGTIVFSKLLFHWVLIHLNDDTIHKYLAQLTAYTSKHTQCYIFEQTNTQQRTYPTSIHIHRTKEEYIKLFEAHGWKCAFASRVWRMPSYGLGLWNKYKWLPAFVFPVLAIIDGTTLYRKPEHIEYTTEVFIFSKV